MSLVGADEVGGRPVDAPGPHRLLDGVRPGDFRLGGAELQSPARERFAEIQDRHAALSQRFGIPVPEMIDRERAAFHASLGLVRQEGERVVVTEAGMPLLDALLGELVSETLVAA